MGRGLEEDSNRGPSNCRPNSVNSSYRKKRRKKRENKKKEGNREKTRKRKNIGKMREKRERGTGELLWWYGCYHCSCCYQCSHIGVIIVIVVSIVTVILIVLPSERLSIWVNEWHGPQKSCVSLINRHWDIY